MWTDSVGGFPSLLAPGSEAQPALSPSPADVLETDWGFMRLHLSGLIAFVLMKRSQGKS